MTRRKFLDTTLAGGATLIAGGPTMIFAANSPAVTEPGTSSVFRLGAIFRSTASALARCASPERAFGGGQEKEIPDRGQDRSYSCNQSGYFSTASIAEGSSSSIHSIMETGRLPFLTKSSWNCPRRKFAPILS